MAGHPSCLSTDGRPKDGARRESLSQSFLVHCPAKSVSVGGKAAGLCRDVQPTPLTHVQPLFWKPEATQMQNQQSEKSRDL